MPKVQRFMNAIQILLEDDQLIAVHKPAGLLTHPSPQAPGVDSCMRVVRDLIGRRVHPVHRLDRATSGVLLFAKGAVAAQHLGLQFQTQRVQKTYVCIVRGWTDEEGLIDHALTEENGRLPQAAVTGYVRLKTYELPFADRDFPTSRYSLVQCKPETGRRHQIRKHLHHISHPIIGDTNYGEGEHNRLFRREFGLHRLLLFAVSLTFRHPLTEESVTIEAPLDSATSEFLARMAEFAKD